MERLTKVDDQGRLLAYSTSDTGLSAIIASGNPYRKLVERLKAYEDTGLEPEEISALKRREKWIPVVERLPESETIVLAYIKRNDVDDGWGACEVYRYIDHWISLCDGFEVVAWMPLPEPYKPEN